jgi:hypothetical protein
VRRLQPPLPPLVTTSAASSGGVQSLRSAQDAMANVPNRLEQVVVALLEIERRNGGRGEDSSSVENSGFATRSDKQLVAWIQSSVQLRRAVSDLVQILQHFPTHFSSHNMSPYHLLCEQVLRIYPRLLELPRLDAQTFAFEISLVVPFYDPAKPSTSSASPAATQLEATIRHALRMCHNPSAVQLILVNSRDKVVDSTTAPVLVDDQGTDRLSSWGATKCLVVPNRGRGPCLNAGAQVATGKILVFCHADTKVPTHWDVAVSNAYRNNSSRKHTVLATAFSFGVDSDAGADERAEGLVPCAVPGLNAVVTTANLRSRWFSLPYGDQCISVPASLFIQVGGFPDVPLMEDYELISCRDNGKSIHCFVGQTRSVPKRGQYRKRESSFCRSRSGAARGGGCGTESRG